MTDEQHNENLDENPSPDPDAPIDDGQPIEATAEADVVSNPDAGGGDGFAWDVPPVDTEGQTATEAVPVVPGAGGPLPDGGAADGSTPPFLPPPAGAPAADPAIPVMEAAATPATKKGWPKKAKVTVGILVVLAALGAAGTAVFYSQASSAENDTDDANAALVVAQRRADDAETQLAEQEAVAQTELAAVTAERDAAQAALDAANAEIETLKATVEELTLQLTEANDKILELETILADLAAPFPVTAAPDLTTANIDGLYSIRLTEIRCRELPQCGQPPQLADGRLTRTGNQLLFSIPGVLEIALTGQESQLFGDAVNQGLAAACGDVPRPQSMTMSLHAATGAVQVDATTTITSIGGSVIINADAAGECGPGEVWYSATLTPVG
jgi:hypothetical protein